VSQAAVGTRPPAPGGLRAALTWRRLLVAGVLVAGAAVLGIDRIGGRGGAPELSAVPDLLRAFAATVVLFAVCGYAPAHVLCPAALRRWLPLLVLPLGAVTSALALTLLGYMRLPLPASLAVVLILGVAGAVVVRRRAPARAEGLGLRRAELLVPASIALVVAGLLLSPMVRHDSFATVLGQNGDAHLATGAAELLKHAPPGSERPELPIDHMPPVWRSKYPIYYVLAAASTLSGLDPVQTFGTVIAVVLALGVLGFYLLAVGVLGAGATGAILAMALVALDRIVYRLGFDPFYNQSWALFTFPFVLVSGWHYLRSPSRGSLTLLLMFGAASVFAYPLLAPFLALFLAVVAWQAWRRARAEGRGPGWIAALRLPRGRRSLVFWIPAVVVLVPVGFGLLAAASDKMRAAAAALVPGGDLGPWSGKTPGFQPVVYFAGVPFNAQWLGVVVLVLALVGLWRTRRDARVAIGVVLVALLLGAAWLQIRGAGALFHFRALSFFGPTVLVPAGIGAVALLARDRPWVRRATLAGLGVLALAMVLNVRDALKTTFPHVTPRVWELRSWSDRFPRDASVRVDVTPVGVQEWAGYMLYKHPQSASHPLLFFFPHPPVGRKADYLLVNQSRRRPADAAGGPLFQNSEFQLYRLRPDLPGRDVSSRKLQDPQLQGGAVGD
jgi:hypothetical protein